MSSQKELEQELSRLRRDVILKNIEIKRLKERLPRLCRECRRMNTRGVFPICLESGIRVAPEDWCSRFKPKEAK